MAKGNRTWWELSVTRSWAGLRPAEWRFAHEEGHHCSAGQAGRPFSMADGFHCPCGGWTVSHNELGGGVVSDVREGYRRFGVHVREVFAAASGPSWRRGGEPS